MEPVAGPLAGPPRQARDGDARIAAVARDLEASFLATMLREAGVGAPRGTFGGGAGEEQFASFLADAYAERLAARGGIGLAEGIFRALKEQADGRA